MSRQILIAAVVLMGLSAGVASSVQAGAVTEIQKTLNAVQEVAARVEAREAELQERLETLQKVKAIIETRIGEVQKMEAGDERDEAAAELAKVIKVYQAKVRELQKAYDELNEVKELLQKTYRDAEDHYASMPLAKPQPIQVAALGARR